MTTDEILFVLFVVAQWISALAIVWFVVFVRRQMNHFREKEFLDAIRDEKFRFPQDLRADETALAGRYVRHWILNHKSTMTYDQYSKHSHRVQNAMLEVLMAYDRVVNDCSRGLSRKTVVKYQGHEVKKLWTVMEPVIMQLRRAANGIPLLCVTLQGFVKSKEFERLSRRYCAAQVEHVAD
ncbi:MAG: hypothetical protein H0U97_20495 [Gammaproteobacteria bacterium]|nr:hypothetical protein [Gammaproteobacteria bacterium]